VAARRVADEMERQGVIKARLAELLGAGRARPDRILAANGAVTIEALQQFSF
jgi:hypothetical protein